MTTQPGPSGIKEGSVPAGSPVRRGNSLTRRKRGCSLVHSIESAVDTSAYRRSLRKPTYRLLVHCSFANYLVDLLLDVMAEVAGL
jgi:hypothetical protein